MAVLMRTAQAQRLQLCRKASPVTLRPGQRGLPLALAALRHGDFPRSV
eukprot:CAMPEP_0113995552 /NCGR_PEP_ID=MMETSP0328-20130328/11276_1 /TAXON_ID=39455 /ORGANISM="Alexandrium minutum" /LENGTH=47 /assembly_acc=CAM_ASM_000350